MLQIRKFVASSTTALQAITRLELIAALDKSEISATNAPHNFIQRVELATGGLMGQLTPMCTQLQQVFLDFNVGVPVLYQFGICCPMLVTLEIALDTLPSSTLSRLDYLLPKVSHLISRNNLAPPGGSEVFHLIDFCKVISKCRRVSRLDLCKCYLAEEKYRAYAGPDDEDIWGHIPPRITHLYCHPWGTGPQEGVQLPNLELLYLGIKQSNALLCNKYPHQLIHNILWACSKLKVLHIRDYSHSGTFSGSFEVVCDNTAAPFLTMLAARMQAGLRFFCDDSLTFGIQLYEPVDLEEMSLQRLLQTLPPLPVFTALTLLAALEDNACLENVARVFPNLRILEIADSCITDDALHSLLPCSTVESLTFLSCASITHKSLFMIEGMPKVEHVQWSGCIHATAAAVSSACNVLSSQGRSFKTCDVTS